MIRRVLTVFIGCVALCWASDSLAVAGAAPACSTPLCMNMHARTYRLEHRIQVETDHLEYLIQIDLQKKRVRNHLKFNAMARKLFLDLHNEIGFVAADIAQHRHVYDDRLTDFLRYRFDRVYNLIGTLQRFELLEAEIEETRNAVFDNRVYKHAILEYQQYDAARTKYYEVREASAVHPVVFQPIVETSNVYWLAHEFVFVLTVCGLILTMTAFLAAIFDGLCK